jgi:hypothetical protein
MRLVSLVLALLLCHSAFCQEGGESDEINWDVYCPDENATRLSTELYQCMQTLGHNEKVQQDDPHAACKLLNMHAPCYPECFCTHALGYPLVVSMLQNLPDCTPSACGGHVHNNTKTLDSPAPALRVDIAAVLATCTFLTAFTSRIQ